MARGRIGSERTAFTSARRRAASVPVDLSGPAPSLSTFNRARDISSAAFDDSDAVRVSSKRQDQKLLDNITNTLYDLEMSTVKPRMDVALKTGFRRLIYDKKRPPLEPQTKARSLSRHLRRPYVYTQDSLFSVPRSHRTKWGLRKEVTPRATYKPFEKEELNHKPRDPTLKMAASYSTRSSEAILDHIHHLASQDYVGETPSSSTDELGLFVSDILNRAKTRRTSEGPKNYYVATEISGAPVDAEDEGEDGSNWQPSYYDGYDVYDAVKAGSNSVYSDDGSEYYFVPETRNARSYRGSSTAPLPWKNVAKTSGVFASPILVPSTNHHRRASVSSVSRNRYAHKRPEVIDAESTFSDTAKAFKNVRRRAQRAVSVPPIPTYASYAPPETRDFIYAAHLPTPARGRSRHHGIADDSPLFVQAGGASPGLRALRREAPLYMSRAYELKPPRRPAPSYRATSWRAGSEPPVFATSYMGASRRPAEMGQNASLAVRQARQCLGRIEKELGKGPSNGMDYYNDPYSGAIEAPMASPIFVPTRVTRAGSSRAMSMPPPPRRYSVSGSPSSLYTGGPSYSHGSRIAGIEARLAADEDYTTPSSFHDLRYKATEARNKLGEHRLMMDRYLPIPSGPLNDVGYEVDYKYNELVPRMPCLDPYKPNPNKYVATPVAPYRPASKPTKVSEYGKPPPGPSFRPVMSDTRKRCRDVLCKVKGDPRYYDY
ncbi:hypothetical protein CAPTEDRAFT_228467 [Capitella teleta]|uniref:Uncharacterized protein n=1 Tax=Capitella teleta TaxID=283909 RepID=R7UXP5_CAPTE|nr:hypothetical protein CAPTEDRAFT_228467 [Capitella teleta]|eukprot:ELU11057.1 hypothetical protein CAPTEDRAFT_228467 [Capitella teleta]